MRKVRIALGAAAGLLVFGLSSGAAEASVDGSAQVSHLAYVSHSAKKSGADTSCKTARYRDVNTAIAAVSVGGTVIVCAGTYDEQVVVTKPLTLLGRGATINAKGQKPLKLGQETLPGSIGIGVLDTSVVRVSGFRVTGQASTPSWSAPARTCWYPATIYGATATWGWTSTGRRTPR